MILNLMVFFILVKKRYIKKTLVLLILINSEVL
jgi:hypothetical protein